jgi:aspartate/methionine/tyrosine aminotransferase
MTIDIAPFHAITISRRAHALKQQGRDIIHMEFGQPSTGAPSRAIEVAHRILDTDGMGYWESPALTERIARHYQSAHRVAVDREQVILTCGASPALVLALCSLFAPGARIALARPGYVAYRNTLLALHMLPVELGCGPDDRYQLSARMLAALDPVPDGVIIASPANPTGTILAPDEISAIASICRQRKIKIVSDEIYHGLSYGMETRSLLQETRDAFIINSFSKYYSMAGWRLGWLVVPQDMIAPVRARIGNMFLTPPSLAQHAGLAAFECFDELDGHVHVYARNRELLLAALPAMGLGHTAPPDGAFYIYADISHLTDDSLAFCAQLLEDTGVATAPGIDFDPVNGHHFMRFSFAVSTALINEAIARLVPWFSNAARASGANLTFESRLDEPHSQMSNSQAPREP